AVARRPADLGADLLEKGEALRGLAATDRLRDEAAARVLHQLERGETVEDRECALADELLDGVRAGGAVAFEVRGGGEDFVVLPSPLTRIDRVRFIVLMREELSARGHAVCFLELPTDVLLEHLSAGNHDTAKRGPKILIHATPLPRASAPRTARAPP